MLSRPEWRGRCADRWRWQCQRWWLLLLVVLVDPLLRVVHVGLALRWVRASPSLCHVWCLCRWPRCRPGRCIDVVESWLGWPRWKPCRGWSRTQSRWVEESPSPQMSIRGMEGCCRRMSCWHRQPCVGMSHHVDVEGHVLYKVAVVSCYRCWRRRRWVPCWWKSLRLQWLIVTDGGWWYAACVLMYWKWGVVQRAMAMLAQYQMEVMTLMIMMFAAAWSTIITDENDVCRCSRHNHHQNCCCWHCCRCNFCCCLLLLLSSLRLLLETLM